MSLDSIERCAFIVDQPVRCILPRGHVGPCAKQPDEPREQPVLKTEWQDLLEAAQCLKQEIERVGHSDYGPACHICMATATIARLSETKGGGL
jgi:hypothetical protein